MKQEDIDLLKKDLSSRIPYGLKVQIEFNWFDEQRSTSATMRGVNGNFVVYDSFAGEEETIITKIKPYLRPLSDMTDEEKEELSSTVLKFELEHISNEYGFTVNAAKGSTFEIDFYNSHHFDYRGLIPKNLALEALEGMYKFE